MRAGRRSIGKGYRQLLFVIVVRLRLVRRHGGETKEKSLILQRSVARWLARKWTPRKSLQEGGLRTGSSCSELPQMDLGCGCASRFAAINSNNGKFRHDCHTTLHRPNRADNSDHYHSIPYRNLRVLVDAFSSIGMLHCTREGFVSRIARNEKQQVSSRFLF